MLNPKREWSIHVIWVPHMGKRTPKIKIYMKIRVSYTWLKSQFWFNSQNQIGQKLNTVMVAMLEGWMHTIIKAWIKSKHANNFDKEHNTYYTYRGY